MKLFKKILSATIALTLCLSFSVTAFASGNFETSSKSAVEDILSAINEEYGTNIHIMASDAKQHDEASAACFPALSASELVALENELRYIAEYEIPEYERATQKAMQEIARVNASQASYSEVRSTETSSYDYEPIIALLAIDYAVAAAEAYITSDRYGNTVWGSVVDKFCITDRTQARWFYAANPTVSRIDGGRTLYWVGSGDYYATIDGVQYYLSSGTQVAEMYVGNYNTWH